MAELSTTALQYMRGKGYDSGDRQYSGTGLLSSKVGPTKSNRVIGF